MVRHLFNMPSLFVPPSSTNEMSSSAMSYEEYIVICERKGIDTVTEKDFKKIVKKLTKLDLIEKD